LSSILAYLAERNPRAVDRIGRRLVVAADKLAPFPHSGRPGVREGTREIATVWPYVIVYRVTETEVQILRILHSARDRA
jgi:plasmid stabilization system protein ParE